MSATLEASTAARAATNLGQNVPRLGELHRFGSAVPIGARESGFGWIAPDSNGDSHSEGSLEPSA